MAPACALALGIAGCGLLAPVDPVPIPPARPDGATATEPSAKSASLARYYAQMQNDLVARGLLRTDGGGVDTPFGPDDLARNFEQIVFFDEYRAGAGISERSAGELGRLRRWAGPVRVSTEFGLSATQETRARDNQDVAAYVDRLARVTSHPISVQRTNPNFHVLFMSADDTELLKTRLRQIVPNIDANTLQIFDDLPRSIHCLVVAFSGRNAPQTYTQAIAVIRAEHSDIVRRACIHEEIAQGLGLANDSPEARPSIFNDDDEFALLTTHDELLLRMLYDPRMQPGMTADEARPITRIIAREVTGRVL